MNIGSSMKTMTLTYTKRLSKHLNATLTGKLSLSESNYKIMIHVLILRKALIDNEFIEKFATLWFEIVCVL